MIAQDPQHQRPAGPVRRSDAMLRAGAGGHVPTEAAVDLLIGHGGWPQRLFAGRPRRHLAGQPRTSPAMAAIDWQAVADRIEGRTEEGFAASSSEAPILALATSLAGRLKVCLGDLLPRLDATNAGLVATADGARLQQRHPRHRPSASRHQRLRRPG